MDIAVRGLGKKYYKTWVFKNFSYHFASQQSYAVIGPNGSGKSTLMQLIAGYCLPTQGHIEYLDKPRVQVYTDSFFQWHTSAAPYMELIEELTLQEFLKFHFKFKKLRDTLSLKEVLRFLAFENISQQYLKHFSSGMKQKLKLGLAFLSDVPIILLDEPTSTLDAKNIEWYLAQIKKLARRSLFIIFSNHPHEYAFCDQIIDIEKFQ